MAWTRFHLSAFSTLALSPAFHSISRCDEGQDSGNPASSVNLQPPSSSSSSSPLSPSSPLSSGIKRRQTRSSIRLINAPEARDTQAQQRSSATHFPFVVLGGGTTAYCAIEAIRQSKPKSQILLVSSELVLPTLHRSDRYNNNDQGSVAIGKDLLSSYNEWRRHITSKLATEPLDFGDSDDEDHDDDDCAAQKPSGAPSDDGSAEDCKGLPRGGLSLLLRQKDLTIDKDNKILSLSSGSTIHFDKLLIATAGRPKSFYVLGDVERGGRMRGDGFGEDCVNSLITLSDFERLEEVLASITKGCTNPEEEKNIVVVGGGFLGTEISLAMATRVRQFNKENDGKKPKVKVVQIYAEVAPLVSYLPKYLANDVKDRLTRHGVSAIPSVLVTDLHVEEEDERDGVKMNLVGVNRSELKADYVIMASSTISPDTKIAKDSGLEIDPTTGGIVVNDNFEVGNGVYAAGVVASYYDANLGRRRVNRYDHSVNSGLLAGFNMVSSGQSEDSYQSSYTHQPAVRSSLPDINVQCESIGECNSDYQTFGVWVDKGEELSSDGRLTDQELLNDVSCMSKYRRGIVYYLQNNKVVGIVLWNCSDLLERARDLIRLSPDVSKNKLTRIIPLAPDDWLFTTEDNGRAGDVRRLTTEDSREHLVQIKMSKSMRSKP